MNDTTMTITGNLTAHPDRDVTTNGTVIARMTVASTPRTYDRRQDAWTDGTTLFLRVIAFGHLAEHATTSLQKGDRVIVTGQLRARTWENDDGSRGTSVDLVAEDIGAALRYATVAISRVRGRTESEAA